LLRGKRPIGHTAASTPPKTGEYQPTAVEVINAQREYKNPFGGAISAPAADTSTEETIAAPAAVPQETKPPEMIVKPAAPTATTAPSVERAASAVPELAPETPDSDARSQLNILPPAELKRTQLHWDKTHSAEKERSPEFTQRPGRDDRRGDRRDGRRDERPAFRSDAQRPRDDARPPRTFQAPVEKPLGFVGRLKRWLGLGKPAPAPGPAPERDFDSNQGNRDQGYRRRRRGGRGFQGGERSQQGGMPQSQGGGGQPFDRRGGDPGVGGHHRRRHRGGRGRDQGGPRPEGQQGGGYI
jgi:translation initiation factor IF-2